MNNLLRTLTESRVKAVQPHTDLKLLLSAVKETRRQSHDVAKLSDAFYDSLEGLLHDLRTVTMDNRDAEAFLKPVSRTDVLDYYDVISNPMDLQTMLKKVKQKQYKSKREFKDDLDLIWSNCFTYNATEDHPLRMCAKRLKGKAEKLLQNITDWKERADPAIPFDISSVSVVAPQTNGMTLNGHARLRTPAMTKSPSPGEAVPAPSSSTVRHDGSFADSPALVRTAEGMAAFLRLDRELKQCTSSTYPREDVQPDLEQRLRQYISVSDDEADASNASLHTIDGDIGEKRKLNGYLDGRPRKRARTHPPVDKDPVELWWDATQSDALISNGLPMLAHRSSEDVDGPAPPDRIVDPPREGARRRKKKRKAAVPRRDTLLFHMNNNIRTLHRVRSTHAKFSALNQNNEEGGGPVMSSEPLPDDAEDVLDERPWKPMGSRVEIGEKNADDCLHWMGKKVLEHVGFQGTSKAALDVLSSVASEYLLNVGRTIRFLCDKYARKMTPEEIILHTLFESGTTRIHELDRYIKDDIIRYGGRLVELEKKLANAYREATTEEAWDDEALFRVDDEEEESQLAMGDFAAALGDDFFGFRELGIASEFGLQSLTIPKKLLKSKKQGTVEGPSVAKPTEPPPPFPPPPPFVPLNSAMVENQIGLLKPFYHQRLSSLPASAALPPVPPAPTLPPHLPGMLPPGPPAIRPLPIPAPNDTDVSSLVLPDDAPSPAHTKIGPLGQVMKNAPSAAASKKKKAKAPAAPMGMVPVPSEGDMPLEFAVPGVTNGADSPRKGQPSGGATPKKKPGNGPGSLPPVVMASA